MSNHNWVYLKRIRNTHTPGSSMAFICHNCNSYIIIQRSKRWRDVPTDKEMNQFKIDSNCDIMMIHKVIECLHVRS